MYRRRGISRAGVIAIVASSFIVMIAAVVFVLAIVFPRMHSTPTVPAPAQVIKDFQSQESTSLSKRGYKTQTQKILNATMLYTPSGSTFAVRLSAAHLVSYSLTNGTGQSNKQDVLNDVAHYLKNNGFTNPTTATLAGSSIATFESPAVVCQLAQYAGSNHIAASFNLACDTHQAFQDELTAVNTLLALYKKSHTLPTIADVTRTHFTDDTKHLDALLINAPTASPSSFTLYFAGLTESDTTYIGSQATVSVDSKTNPGPSDDLVAALKDPRYGDFLTQHIILNR